MNSYNAPFLDLVSYVRGSGGACPYITQSLRTIQLQLGLNGTLLPSDLSSPSRPPPQHQQVLDQVSMQARNP